MNVIVTFVISACVFLCTAAGLCDEPQRKTDEIRFAEVIPWDGVGKEPCLAKPFEPGLNVIMIGNSGTCTAKTGTTAKYKHMDYTFPVTRLQDPVKCSDFRSILAIVGLEAPAVRVVPVKKDYTFLTKERDGRARKLIESSINKVMLEYLAMDYSSPIVSKAGPWTLLVYYRKVDDVEGPPILFFQDKIFLLKEYCTSCYDFFSVNGKLHLSYHYFCCGCGDRGVLVYDLSSGEPKMVFAAGALGT